MTDPFASFTNTVSSPGTSWSAITPSDTADLPNCPKGILVLTSGDVKMIGKDAASGDTGTVFVAVPAYTYLPLRPRRILATGTTAASIIAIY